MIKDKLLRLIEYVASDFPSCILKSDELPEHITAITVKEISLAKKTLKKREIVSLGVIHGEDINPVYDPSGKPSLAPGNAFQEI